MKKFVWLYLALLFFSSCTPEPQPIDFGKEGCHHCKMTIVDQRYGAELVTKKGKVFKYDAIECLINSVYSDHLVDTNQIHSLWVIDYSNPKKLIPAEQMKYLHSQKLPSPMGMFLTAFSNEAQLKEIHLANGGDIWNWSTTKSFVLEGENNKGN